jgi:hypothetical protein
VGHYVQVSSSSPKPEYKDRIFRVFSVGKEASTLEYLDDQEPAKKPNIRNRFLLVPNSSAVNLHEYENLKVLRPSDAHWTHIPSVGVDQSAWTSRRSRLPAL